MRIVARMGRCRLLDEHQEARELLAHVQASPADLPRLIDLLEAHFRFEEEVLLPLLAERLPQDTGPIPVIQEEHRTLRRILGRLRRDPAGEERERLATLLLSHFEKEEELLLPFAREQLDCAQLAQIGCAPGDGHAPSTPSPSRPEQGS